MKKLTKTLMIIFLLLVALPIREVSAVTGSISISGKQSLIPGEKATYVVTFNSSDTAYFSYKITGDNLTVTGDTSSGAFGSGENKTESLKISATAKSIGSASITVSGSVASTVDGSEKAISNSMSISVVAPTPSKPAPSTPSPSKPGSDGKENTSTQKTAAQLEAERVAREKAELEKKEAQEAEELEAKKKTPMFSAFSVVSSSEKLKGETLTTIETQVDKFEYDFTLPKRIDSFSLDLKALEGANLTYDKDHAIPEGETSVVIPVKAVMDDISQDFKVTVSKNTDTPIAVTVGEKTLEVYDDELLDAAMTTLGFEKATFEQGEAQVPYFVKGAMSLALLQDGEDVSWYALNDAQEFTDSGVLYLDEDNKALFILEADEEVSANRLYQNAYSEKTLEAREELASVDSSLDFAQTYKSWQYDETREVVYGFDESGDKDFYVFGDNKIKAAVVGFDTVDKTYQMISWGLGGVLFSLVGTGSLFALAQKKNGNKDEDLVEEDYIQA